MVRRIAKGPKRALTTEEEREVVEKYVEGESVQKLSETFDVSNVTIHNTLHRYNVPTRPELAKRHLTNADRASIITTCSQPGVTVKQVADAHHTSEATVARVLREHRAQGSVLNLPKGRKVSVKK